MKNKIYLIIYLTFCIAGLFSFSFLPFKLPSFAKSALNTTLPGKSLPTEKTESFNDYSVIFSQSLPLSSTKKRPRSATSFPENSTPVTFYSAPVPDYITETEITKGGTSLFGIEINNETDYNLTDALKDVYIPENPTVLIVHTHTSESYRPSDAYPYTPTDNSRTEDTSFNVARVGAELARELSSYGINVIHDSSVNDYPSYNGSYKKTLGLIESLIEKNPEIDMVIDLHRDAMERSDGTKISTVCSVNGEKAAQVMFVVGTDQGGLTHQNWRDNFSFAVKLQTIINENFPHLARPVNVRSERFNGHTSPKELIIEVGTTGNTLEEALVSARALAFSINEFYTG